MSASEILEGVADEIEKWGWAQGSECDLEGRVCIVGGMRLTTGQVQMGGVDRPSHFLVSPERPARIDWVSYERAQKHFMAKTGMPMPHWNDEPGRTKEEVLDMLRECAKELRMWEESGTEEEACHAYP